MSQVWYGDAFGQKGNQGLEEFNKYLDEQFKRCSLRNIIEEMKK